jgi:hypothetical protein
LSVKTLNKFSELSSAVFVVKMYVDNPGPNKAPCDICGGINSPKTLGLVLCLEEKNF